MIVGIVFLVDPRLFLRAVTGGAAARPALDAFAYDATFVRQRLPVMVALLALNALVYAVVAVHGGWRRGTRRADIGLTLAITAAMAWLVVAGNIYQAPAADRSVKLALLILIAVGLPIAVTRIRRARVTPRAA